MRSWVLTGLSLLFACGKGKAPVEAAAEAPPSAEVTAMKVDFVDDPEADGLTMRLYEASAQDLGLERAPQASATPLSAQEAAGLIARLPKLEGEDDDALAFALRQGPQPPPRTGATVQEAFPPVDDGSSAPKVDSGPLTVLRKAPVGAVPMAPHLSLTFSQPMIPVTSQTEASKIVPATLEPQPEGQWRWLGTKTLQFDPEPRFPMATRYTVTVPAGTKGEAGGALAAAETWTFETPPPTLQSYWPYEDGGWRRGYYGNPQPADPLIFVGFDQAVSPEAIAGKLSVRGAGETVPLRLATPDELAADEEMSARVKAAEPGRAVVLKAVRDLALNTGWRVTVPVGTPSAEGPLTTTAEQGFDFRTYGPFLAVDLSCYNERPCPPTYPWTLTFTNPLDAERFDPAAVTVTPAVPGLQILPSGQTVMLQGAFAARTTYSVTVAAGVLDVFGQKLEKPATFSIEVGPADKSFSGPSSGFVVVDPNAPPAVSFFSVNHKSLRATVHRVEPGDWDKWVEWNQRYRWEDARKAPLPGTRVSQSVVQVKGESDRMTETALDLKPWLKEGAGQFLILVEPTDQPRERWARQEWIGWVQVSKLGLTAFVDHEELTAWVTRLEDGEPVAGADLSLVGMKLEPAKSGKDGLGRLKLTNDAGTALVARLGADTAMLPQNAYAYGGGWTRVEQIDQQRWYTFTDKNLYKPKETVHVRGWLRTMPAGKGQDLRAFENRDRKIVWRAYSSVGNPLGEGVAPVSGLGGFQLELKLPDTPNLGTARVEMSIAGDVYGATTQTFEIQEYRTPEFEVSTSGGDGVYTLGEDAFVDVKAAYYAGGVLPNAPVTWSVSAAPASFTPPGRSDWSFGDWSPWWRWWSDPEPYREPQTLTSTTDGSGEQHLGIHFVSVKPAKPMTVTAEASVMDVNRQTWASSKSFLVHPAAWYVGLRAKTYVEQGEPIEIESLVVDREGKEVAHADVTLELRRLTWKNTGRGWSEVPETVGTANVGAAGKTSLKPEAGGSYAIVATLRDPQGRKNQTEIRVYVSGGDLAPDRGVEQERVTLVPDRETWKVGETAGLLVQAPFFPAEGVLTLRAGGLLETRTFHLEGSSTRLEVPITDAHIPDLTVSVDLVGARVRSDDDGKPRPDLAKRPAYAAGTVTLKVPPLERTLAVTVTPAKSRLDPGAGTTVAVGVKDAAGRPVSGAELAVVAVDEAVLALTGYRLPDPLDAFYAARGSGVADHHLRQHLALARPEAAVAGPMGGLGASGYGRGGGGFGAAAEGAATMSKDAEYSREMRAVADAPAPPPAASATQAARKKNTAAEPMEEMDASPDVAANGPAIQVRSNFSALALWAPSVTTDGSGQAKVELKLPDNLTRYRIMVVAVAGARQFGAGEADVTARLPLMVRPSAPRFLNFGDRFELPIVVQNQTDAPMTVNVAVKALNASFLNKVTDPIPDPAKARGGLVGARVSVPANDRVEVRFPAAAAMAGTARFQVAVTSGDYADAANVELPVWTPATTEAFATYGTFDQGAVFQPVAPPPDVWGQYGGLEVTLSSTQLQALTDAFIYLARYPYDCNEQISSRLVGIAALRDVLGAFGSDQLPSDAELQRIVAADLERLARRQNYDGGFAFWRRGDPSWPYVSVHVADAIVRAKLKGYAVDPTLEARSLHYLDNIRSHIPHWYSQEAKWYLRGYALHVLSLSGRDQLGKAKALLSEAGVDKLPAEAKGWILPILVNGKATKEAASLVLWLNNHLTESAAGAHLTTSYSDGDYVLLHSDRGVDGVWLEALLRTDPKNDVVPKLVNGLLAHQKAGRWGNTTENAFVLLALDRYFRVYEGVTPDFVARVWLGDGLAGDHTFAGRSTDRVQIDVPMQWLQEKGRQDLVIGREGKGRLYYRVGLRYAPTDLDPEAADYGFTVLRTYEGVDDPGDVWQDADGVWHVKAGKRVRVKLTMVNPMRRYHVALVDPLPAGLEVLNPELKGTGALPEDPTANKEPWWWWSRPWFEHENLRDERVEAFTSLLWDGVHEYSYVARATTPGDFVVPPAKAEEMYSPETFGRSDGDRLKVE